MELLKIEKMRRFYEIFPYPNRPLIVLPKIEAQFTAHGGFGFGIALGKTNIAYTIWKLSNDFSVFGRYANKKEWICIFVELKNLFSDEKRILLVGCGTDEPVLFRKLHPKNEIIAIDLSRKAIEKAKKKISFLKIANFITKREKTSKIEFLQGNAEVILNEKALGKFDFIQCFGVLHHQPEPLQLFSAMAQKLNSGGVLRLMVYSFHGRKLERRIQTRYQNIWSGFFQKKHFRFRLLLHYSLLRFWQFFNFLGFFASSRKRFYYLGPGSVSVADAFMHPSDPGIPLNLINEMAKKLELEMIYCEGKLEDSGYVLGFDDPISTWNKIVEADEKQELLTNPIIIFRKV